MNHDLLKILSDSNKDIDNQKLMDYLAGHLPANETHEVEKSMAENEFIRDAVEGLQGVNSQKNIEELVKQLNKDLHNKLDQKKLRKQKRRLKEHAWIYVAIILILSLLVITWFVMQRIHAVH